MRMDSRKMSARSIVAAERKTQVLRLVTLGNLLWDGCLGFICAVYG